MVKVIDLVCVLLMAGKTLAGKAKAQEKQGTYDEKANNVYENPPYQSHDDEAYKDYYKDYYNQYYSNQPTFEDRQAAGAPPPAAPEAPVQQPQQFDAIGVALGIGVANLAITGIAYNLNKVDIDNLKERATRLEKILASTCATLNSFTSVGGTPGNAAANAAILTNMLAVSNPTCAA